MKALFIVNARSGSNRRRDIRSLINTACDWAKFEIASCERKEDLDRMIEEAERDGYDAVFAVGGDGTVHETAKRLIGRHLALGIIPTGSGNGVARHLGVPMSLPAALAAYCDATMETIDTAEINGTPYVGIAGIGFDAEIAAEFAKHNARGLRTYLRCGFKVLFRYKPEEVEIDTGSGAASSTAYLVTVANISQFGNNMRIAPLASVQDGVLDLVVIRDTSILSAPILTARVYSGTLHRSRTATMRRVEQVTIRRQSAGAAHLDGEPVTMPEVLTVKVVPRSLRVLVPRGAKI